jgi:hypothetical protein
VRTIDEQAAPPASIRATTLEETQAAIRAAWGRDTSADPEEWSELNPARGKCAVTALLVRELLGGEILVANVLRDGRRVERHAWNRFPSGPTLDLTREQFVNGERFGEPSPEEPLLTHRNPERLATLRARVPARLELGQEPATRLPARCDRRAVPRSSGAIPLRRDGGHSAADAARVARREPARHASRNSVHSTRFLTVDAYACGAL